jgi:hypothetical protein
MSEKHIYDEYKVPSQFWGWVLLILFAAAIVSYGMWLMMVVPDAPRFWDHGQKPDTPAESVYSTYQPLPIWTEKRVVAPLPEGKPLEPESRPPKPGRY